MSCPSLNTPTEVRLEQGRERHTLTGQGRELLLLPSEPPPAACTCLVYTDPHRKGFIGMLIGSGECHRLEWVGSMLIMQMGCLWRMRRSGTPREAAILLRADRLQTVLITLFTLTMHATHYQQPAAQKQVMRVLLMPAV